MEPEPQSDGDSEELEEFRRLMSEEAEEAFRQAEEDAAAQGKTIAQVWAEFWATVRARYEERERERKKAEGN